MGRTKTGAAVLRRIGANGESSEERLGFCGDRLDGAGDGGRIE